MAPVNRLGYPEDPTTFVYQGPGEPILTPPRTGIRVFADRTATALADIVTPDGTPIAGSTVYTGSDGMIPLFYGPLGNTSQLWGQVVGTTAVYPLDARYSDQLGMIPTLVAHYEFMQVSPDTTWTVDHPLPFRPNVSTIDSSGQQVWGDISYPSPTRVVISFSTAFGGTALLS